VASASPTILVIDLVTTAEALTQQLHSISTYYDEPNTY